MALVDTSVVVAYYVPEATSHRVQKLFSSGAPLSICALTQVEFASAIARLVRTNAITAQAGRRVMEAFEAHIGRQLYSFCPITPKEYDLARDWLGSFKTSLRTLDALQLAIAHSNALPLITSDKTLAKAARQLGVAIETPG
jgi:predicted nucleic acid-binding protein